MTSGMGLGIIQGFMVWKHSTELDPQHMLICKMLCSRWNSKKSQRNRKNKSQWKSHKPPRSWWKKLKMERGLVFDQVFDQVLSVCPSHTHRKFKIWGTHSPSNSIRYTILLVCADSFYFWKVGVGFAPCLTESFGWMQTNIHKIINFLSLF